MPGVFDPTKAFTTRSHPFSLHWQAIELIDVTLGRGFGVPLESISISEVGGNGASSINFTVQDAKRVLALPPIGRLQLNDHAANEVLFAGFAQGRRTQPGVSGKVGYSIEVTGTDYSTLFDTTFVPAIKHKAGASDKALIQSVVANSIRHTYIHGHSAFVTSTNSDMPAFDFTHLSLRAAIESIQAAAGADRHYYVDFLGRLHYFLGPTESAMGAAPTAITDSATGAGTAAEDLHVEYDDSQIVNAVYIFGANAAGSGWERDEASIKLYGLRQGSFDAPHCKTAAHRGNVGSHYLKLHKDPVVRGSFTLTGSQTGWRVGQTVTITSTPLGISAATYPIVQIDTTFLSGTGIRQRVISFGDLPASGRRKPKIHPLAAASTGPVAAPKPVAKSAGATVPRDKARL